MVLRAKTLTARAFRHGFSTRALGDFAVLRDPARLRASQARLAEEVGFDLALLHQSIQVHGAAVVVANGDPAAALAQEADALVAEPGSGHAVLVRVADCVPVLLADPASGRVAAAHAGWRGVEGGVLRATVARLAADRGLVAAIGPSIGACCFEVGDDVADRIVRASTPAARLPASAPGKARIDLRAAVRAQLAELGLSDDSIEDVPGCTRCEPERFHSYRRDGDASGRLAAVIVAS